MSALFEEKTAAQPEADDLEPKEEALAEITRQLVIAGAAHGRLQRRRDEVMMDVREARRRRARGTLDAYIPPLNIFKFERATPEPAPPPTLEVILRLLYDALDDVLRIWWGKHFLVWWRAR